MQNNLNLSDIYNVVVNANCSIESPLAVNNFNESPEIALFPNLTSDMISFNTKSKIDKIEIYNLNGRKVNENENSRFINVQQLRNGLYFAKAYRRNNSKTKKFLKNKVIFDFSKIQNVNKALGPENEIDPRKHFVYRRFERQPVL